MIANSSTGVFYALGCVIIEGFVIRYDLKTIIPSEKENKVDHVGIPMIIVGTFTLHSFGIGVSILSSSMPERITELMTLIENKKVINFL